MANPIKSLEVAIRYDNARVLSWSLEPGYNYPEKFLLSVENSRDGGPWETLDDDVSDQCYYVDSRRRNWNKHMNEHYRLRLTVPGTTENYVSQPIAAGIVTAYPFSSEASNAIKQIETAIEQSGVTGVLLKRKVFGQRCPACTDFHTDQTVNEHCPLCFGTGILGGFYPGISMSLVKDKIETTEQPTQLGYSQTEVVTARCIAYPWIKVGDIWCEDHTNTRYRITTRTPSATYKTTDLVYSLKMSRLEYTDSAYTKGMDDKVVVKDRWTDDKDYTVRDELSAWDKALNRL